MSLSLVFCSCCQGGQKKTKNESRVSEHSLDSIRYSWRFWQFFLSLRGSKLPFVRECLSFSSSNRRKKGQRDIFAFSLCVSAAVVVVVTELIMLCTHPVARWDENNMCVSLRFLYILFLWLIQKINCKISIHCSVCCRVYARLVYFSHRRYLWYSFHCWFLCVSSKFMHYFDIAIKNAVNTQFQPWRCRCGRCDVKEMKG